MLVTEWESAGIPKKVEEVCCDTLVCPKLVVPDIVVMICSGCGKKYRNPRSSLMEAANNPNYDATAS